VSRDGKLLQAEDFCKILQEETGVVLLLADSSFGN
jgi:hypothetical protein